MGRCQLDFSGIYRLFALKCSYVYGLNEAGVRLSLAFFCSSTRAVIGQNFTCNQSFFSRYTRNIQPKFFLFSKNSGSQEGRSCYSQARSIPAWMLAFTCCTDKNCEKSLCMNRQGAFFLFLKARGFSLRWNSSTDGSSSRPPELVFHLKIKSANALKALKSFPSREAAAPVRRSVGAQ